MKSQASFTCELLLETAQFSPPRMDAACWPLGRGTTPHENFAPCLTGGTFQGPLTHIAAFCAINCVIASCCAQFRLSEESEPSFTSVTRNCNALTAAGLSIVFRSSAAPPQKGRNWKLP